MPDKVFALVQAGLVGAKSIGFLPLKVRPATAAEMQQNAWPADVLVIENWLLLEYACCWLPENQEAIVQEVSKSLARCRPVLDRWRQKPSTPIAQKSFGNMAFTPEEEVLKALPAPSRQVRPRGILSAGPRPGQGNRVSGEPSPVRGRRTHTGP